MSLVRTCNSPTLTAAKAPLTGAQVAGHASSWIGTKWKHEGRTQWGLDCVGLTIVCAWHTGFPGYQGYDYKGYARHPVKETLLNEYRKQMIEIDPRKAEPGCVLVFDQNGYAPYHVAVKSDYDDGMIHAYLPARKTINDNLGRLTFSLELTHAFAYKGVNYKWAV